MNPHTLRAAVCLRFLLLPCALFLAALVIWFAWLRETPVFWRNEGGYPIWLRELVLEAFLPVLVIHIALLVLITASLLMQPPRSGAWRFVESCAAALLWAMMAATIAIMLLNNVLNLIDGRPLHSHPEESAGARSPTAYLFESL